MNSLAWYFGKELISKRLWQLKVHFRVPQTSFSFFCLITSFTGPPKPAQCTDFRYIMGHAGVWGGSWNIVLIYKRCFVGFFLMERVVSSKKLAAHQTFGIELCL